MSGLARRLAGRLLLLVAVVVAIRLATRLLPGDPARAALGPQASPSEVAAAREALGLDRPVLTSLVDQLGGLLRGDLGTTMRGEPITTLLAGRWQLTGLLACVALVIAVPLALWAGSRWALYSHRRSARAWQIGTAAGAATPELVVGTVLLVVFALVLNVLPAVTMVGADGGLQAWDMLVLPVAALALPFVAWQTRVVHASVREALAAPHVAQARRDGVGDRALLRRHALPTAAPAIASSLAVGLPSLLGGTVVVETLFNYPGLGLLLAGAVESRDAALVTALTIVTGLVMVLALTMADVIGTWVRGWR